MSVVRLAQLEIKGLTRERLLEDTGQLKFIVTVNAEFIILAKDDPRMRRICSENFATIDGQIPYLAARLLNRGVRFERIAGSEFIYDICDFARDHGKSIFLLGGSESSNRAAVQRLHQRFNIRIDGFSPEQREYPFDAEHNERLLGAIERFRPDFLLLALSTPKGVLWIDEHREALQALGVRWTLEIGGTFDMVAGKIKKAPWPLPQMGLEWLWRTALQPSRIGRLLRIIRRFPPILFEGLERSSRSDS